MKTLRWSLGITRRDRERNDSVRCKLGVAKVSKKVQESRLRWYGHVLRREEEYVGRKVLKMKLPGKRKRGRPKWRWMDNIKKDMEEVGLEEVDAQDRLRWRQSIRCGDP